MSEQAAKGGATTGSAEAPAVTIRREGATAIIRIDRPKALNAISAEVRKPLAEALPKLAVDPNVYGLVMTASGAGREGKVFSAGGDLRELLSLSPDPAAVEAATREEYGVVYQCITMPKPTVSLIDGLVIGAGVGLTLHGTHRIAGERYRFQMPETAIGLIPDDGACYALSRLPKEIGTYLALTGRAVSRADAVRLKLATHAIPAREFPNITGHMAAADPIDEVLDGLCEDPGPGELEPYADLIEACFNGLSLIEISERLRSAASESGRWGTEGAKFAHGVLADLLQRSPLALHATLRHLRICAIDDIRGVLRRDFRLCRRLIAESDFSTGVCVALGLSQGPTDWNPAVITEVNKARIDRLFSFDPGHELELPTFSEMPFGAASENPISNK